LQAPVGSVGPGWVIAAHPHRILPRRAGAREKCDPAHTFAPLTSEIKYVKIPDSSLRFNNNFIVRSNWQVGIRISGVPGRVNGNAPARDASDAPS
ncbi:MAG: hypothetical protein ACYCX8_07865, partial [Acidimicrobiales bacterium]